MWEERRRKNFVENLRSTLSRRERKVIQDLPFSRAAVLVPLFTKEDLCHLLFTKRTHQVKHHKGEISFPGGVFDEEDRELKRTALREASEEIGLREDDVQMIGMLDDIVTITKFIVTPFVGLFPYPYPFQPSPMEIAELIEVPILTLLDEKNRGERLVLREGKEELVDTYQYGGHEIWGATARILKQFLDVISPKEPT